MVLALVNYIIASVYKIAIWRIIPCIGRSGSPTLVSRTVLILIKACLSLGYTGLLVLEPNWSYIILHYRAFNRLFHNPAAASLESFILFLYI